MIKLLQHINLLNYHVLNNDADKKITNIIEFAYDYVWEMWHRIYNMSAF